MAVAFVQSEKQTGHNAGSAAKAFTSNNTAGNCLVVAVGVWKSGGGFNDPTVTDTLGNTYVKLLATPRNTSCAYLFVAYNCAAGANTVTVNVGTTSDIDFAIHEYSGVATVTARDQIASGSRNNTKTILAGTIQTQFANEVVFSFAYDQQNGTQTFTPSAGWTARQQTSNPGAESLASYDQVVSATGSFTNTITISGTTSNGLHAIIASFADTSTTDKLVQIGQAASSSSSSLAIAFPANNTSGNLLLLAIGRWISTTLGTITSVTDSQGNTWVLVGSTPIAAASGHGQSQAHLYACASCVAGANTVTVATSSAQDLNLTVLEYSPSSITTAVTNSNTVSPVASGSVNADPGLAVSLAYNQSADAGNYSDVSATGWKQRTNNISGSSTTLSVFDQILPSATSIEATMSTSVSNGLHVIVSGKLPTTQPIMMFLIS